MFVDKAKLIYLSWEIEDYRCLEGAELSSLYEGICMGDLMSQPALAR